MSTPRFHRADIALSLAFALFLALSIWWVGSRGDNGLTVFNLVLAQVFSTWDGDAPYFRASPLGRGVDWSLDTFRVAPGRAVILSAEQSNSPGLQRALVTARGVIAIFLISLVLVVMAIFWPKRSRGRERILRGPRLLDLTGPMTRLRCAGVQLVGEQFGWRSHQLRIGQVSLGVVAEVQHVLAVGGTGSGKSTAIISFLADVLAFRHKAKSIVLDLGGTFHAQFARPGDVVLNPFLPTVSARWSIFNEIGKVDAEIDFARLASGLLPGDGSQQNAEWSAFARPVLAALLARLFERGGGAVDFATAADPGRLAALLEGRSEVGILKTASSGSSGSVQFMVLQAIEKISSVMIAFEKCKGPQFSIREWVGDQKPGVLWLTFNESQRAILQPFHSLILSEIAKTALDLHPSNNRRIFVFADELGSLGRIDGFQDLLEKGRKFGVGVVACLQSVAQLNANYGREEARILLDNFRNLLVLNTPGYESADYFSKALGSAEVEREEVGYSRNAGAHGHSVNTRRETRPVVLAGEITSLPSLVGFCRTADNPGVVYKTKINIFRGGGTK